ncbi:hypothetical protein NOVA_67 [Mycobacterium phage Nova]|uniref:Uncharacterized protein n=1 Tax=Mycobacterium phage Nova TaxID=1089130 RepID=G8IAS6_9CAUD|nr:hypothetical protein NOVA_67 [Mycobacterium phage Nova]
MGKKKKRVGKPGPKHNPLKLVGGGEDSAARVTKVIQNMLKPPETVLAHIQRVGAPFWVAPFGVSQEGEQYARPCLVVPYDDLISAELAHLAAGGELAETYTEEARKASLAAARSVAGAQPKSDLDPTAILAQIKEMQQQVHGAQSRVADTASKIEPTELSDEERDELLRKLRG